MVPPAFAAFHFMEASDIWKRPLLRANGRTRLPYEGFYEDALAFCIHRPSLREQLGLSYVFSPCL